MDHSKIQKNNSDNSHSDPELKWTISKFQKQKIPQIFKNISLTYSPRNLYRLTSCAHVNAMPFQLLQKECRRLTFTYAMNKILRIHWTAIGSPFQVQFHLQKEFQGAHKNTRPPESQGDYIKSFYTEYNNNINMIMKFCLWTYEKWGF